MSATATTAPVEFQKWLLDYLPIEDADKCRSVLPKHGIQSAKDVTLLKSDDLDKIGFNIGERNRILDAVKRYQLSSGPTATVISSKADQKTPLSGCKAHSLEAMMDLNYQFVCSVCRSSTIGSGVFQPRYYRCQFCKDFKLCLACCRTNTMLMKDSLESRLPVAPQWDLHSSSMPFPS